MSTDFRALCAELVDYWKNDCPVTLAEVMERARAALAKPEPEGPSDEELRECWVSECPDYECQTPLEFARAVLARWGQPS